MTRFDPLDKMREITTLAQKQIDAMYEVVGIPESGTVLDQSGLRDGLDIVVDYIEHGETGVALEHLLYMVEEAELSLDDDTAADLRALCTHFSIRQAQ